MWSFLKTFPNRCVAQQCTTENRWAGNSRELVFTRVTWELGAWLLTEGGQHRVPWGRYDELRAEEEWEGRRREMREYIEETKQFVETPHDRRHIMERGLKCWRSERRPDGQRAGMEGDPGERSSISKSPPFTFPTAKPFSGSQINPDGK